jgi:Tfp pilus assembly protein PilX
MTRTRRTNQIVRDERGFAIIIVMLILLIGLAIGAAAVAETLDSRDAANRQNRLDRSQAAADAGIQAQAYLQSDSPAAILTTYNLNGGLLGVSTPFLACTVAQLNGSALTGVLTNLAVGVGSVCPPSATTGGGAGTTVPTHSDGNHAFDESEFIPDPQMPFGNGETVLYPKIVSLGWDDNGNASNADKHIVYDREEAILAPIAPLQAVEAQGNLTLSGVSLLGINTAGVVNGNIQAGGSVTAPLALVMADLTGSSILGTVTHGGGYSGPALTVGAGVFQAAPPQRQPITVSDAKPSCPDAGDTCSGISSGYNAATDTFSLSSGQSATFAAGDYVFCSFDAASGSTVTAPSITATGPVRIFIDSPTSKRCNSTVTNASLNQYNDRADANRGNFLAPSGVTNGLLSALTDASDLQIYVVGDQNATDPYDNATTVNVGASTTCTLSVPLVGTCIGVAPVTLGMVIYAPTSTVTVNTGACVTALSIPVICTGGVFEGSVVGDNVTVSAATISQDLDVTNYPLYNGVNAIHPIAFKQCTAVTSLAGLAASPSSTAAATDLSGC